MAETSLHPVARALDDAPWFRAGGIVLAAVSGGADSMAMLDALCALARRRAGLRVIAAHFDHRLREGSERDADVIIAHAERLGARVVRGSGDVATLARRGGHSLEAAARRARYQFLDDVARRESAAWIATAHTRSDQAETVLMRILRGTGTRGLAGIATQRGAIVRPLLGVTRAETRDYCASRGVAYVDDPSNEDRRFERNAIRHGVLPALRLAYPSIDETLVRLAESSARAMDSIRSVTTPRLDAALARESARTWALDARALDGLDVDETAVLIGDALERLDRREDVARAHYEAVASLRVGSSIDLPRVRVRRDHDALVFTIRGGGEPLDSAVEERTMAVPGVARVGVWTVRSEAVTGADAWAGLVSPRDDRVRGFHVAFATFGPGDSLCVRAPRAGDRVQPLGMTGHRKLSDVFIDARVPARRRAGCPVVERNGVIVWVPGVVTCEAARVRADIAGAVRLVACREGANA